MLTKKGSQAKGPFFLFRQSCQDIKGLSGIKTLLTPLACEILMK